MSTCARCGSALTPGAQFCRACGAPLVEGGPPAAPSSGPRPDWRPPAQVLPAPTAYGSAPPPPPRTPRPARRGGPRPALVAGAVLAVLTVAGAATGVILRSADRAPAPAVPTFAPAPLPPVRISVPTSEPARQPSSAPSTAAAPEDELRRQLDTNSDTVESLVGKWVPQLSSKRPGTVASGRTDDAAAILAEHEQLRARHPGARLL